jgi:hypothetical protein
MPTKVGAPERQLAYIRCIAALAAQARVRVYEDADEEQTERYGQSSGNRRLTGGV